MRPAAITRCVGTGCGPRWRARGQITELRAEGLKSTDPQMAAQFAATAPLVRFYNPDNAALLATEPGARNLELYPLFAGPDVDFIIGGQVAQIPDFRPRLKEVSVPVMVLAGRYDRALHPALQRQFTQFAPQIRLRSWSAAARSPMSRNPRPSSP